jgi:hypothetical protein
MSTNSRAAPPWTAGVSELQLSAPHPAPAAVGLGLCMRQIAAEADTTFADVAILASMHTRASALTALMQCLACAVAVTSAPPTAAGAAAVAC